MFRTSTIIVGAGISGLACARTLFDAGVDFAVISENVGGRILQSSDGAVPLGAFYVRADSEHVNRFVTRGHRLRSGNTIRHDSNGGYTRWDRRLLAHPSQTTRFVLLLLRFRRHYERYKTNALTMSQARAIATDGFLNRLYHQPAAETISQYDVRDVAESYIDPGLRASAFLPLNRLTGFTMLLGSLPAITPTWEFTMRWHDLLAGFEHRLTNATVTRIDGTDGIYRVEVDHGRAWEADNIVVATDPTQAQRLLNLKSVNEPVAVHMFEIAGALRPEWGNARLHLFTDDHPILAIVQQPSGPTLLVSHETHPTLDRYFSTWTILEHHFWEPAFNLLHGALIECEQAANLYVIGDHNVCGLEDAYITGVYAANQIIATAGTLAPTTAAPDV